MARITRRLHDRVQRHREAIYTWTFVIFSTSCVFVPCSMDERFFRTSRYPISPVAREESAITKMGRKKAWKVEIPRWELSRLSVVEKTIEMGSRLLHPPLQKFRQFSSNAREPCLPSLRAMCCLVAASLKCDTIPISTYWDDLSATSRWR